MGFLEPSVRRARVGAAIEDIRAGRFFGIRPVQKEIETAWRIPMSWWSRPEAGDT